MDSVDVVVIGGGQSGLSAGYFLRRSGLSYVILDAEASPGGAWQHAWHSLHLFSPAGWSSIPGWPMPASQGPYPARAEVLAYLAQYEQKYALPVLRPIRVQRVSHFGERLRVVARDGRQWLARAVIDLEQRLPGLHPLALLEQPRLQHPGNLRAHLRFLRRHGATGKLLGQRQRLGLQGQYRHLRRRARRLGRLLAAGAQRQRHHRQPQQRQTPGAGQRARSRGGRERVGHGGRGSRRERGTRPGWQGHCSGRI